MLGRWPFGLPKVPSGRARGSKKSADAIEAAVRPDAAGVFLCTLGNMLHATCAMAPREHASVGERLIAEFLPRVHAEGLDTPWDVFAADPDLGERAITRPIQTELLEPAGFEGIFGVFMRSRDGMIAGCVAVFTRGAARERRPNRRAAGRRRPRDGGGDKERHVLATSVGARFPKISPDPLSGREREIARLAANGLSDLNIAARLAITEGTVGRHLHNIFRKLGVSSRLELGDLLCMGE